MEGRFRIPEKLTSCLSYCHEAGDSKATGEEEGVKFCADGIIQNCENEGNVGHWGEKDYAFLNAEQIVYISLVIITFILLLFKFKSNNNKGKV